MNKNLTYKGFKIPELITSISRTSLGLTTITSLSTFSESSDKPLSERFVDCKVGLLSSGILAALGNSVSSISSALFSALFSSTHWLLHWALTSSIKFSTICRPESAFAIFSSSAVLPGCFCFDAWLFPLLFLLSFASFLNLKQDKS